MRPAKIALIGAGSRSFGPATVRDALLSDPLAEAGIVPIYRRPIRHV